MKQNEYEWAGLSQLIPAHHRYKEIHERLSPVLGELDLNDDHMPWMIILQICDGLSETKLLMQLPENFYMRWFCGYGLSDEIVSAARYANYKRSISAYRMVKLVRAVFQSEMTCERFMSAMEMILNEASAQKPTLDDGQTYYVLASKKSECLVELLENSNNIELAYSNIEDGLQNLAVLGSEESLKKILEQIPRLAVGVSQGCEWERTLDIAQAALQEQLVDGIYGARFSGENSEIHIVNLLMADKRMALENFLKESRLEQAHALFEDMIARLKDHAKEMHWMQRRHELLKIFCALYNGGFHYQQSDQFCSTYIHTLKVLAYGSFDEIVETLRSIIQGFEIHKYQDVIAVRFDDYGAAAKEMIEKFYATDLTLGDLARHLGITPEYLSSSFRKSVGRSFVDYLTDVRIEHACKLLTFSTFKVNEVAHMVGFYNADYFGRVFKQKMHITPRQYQKSKT